MKGSYSRRQKIAGEYYSQQRVGASGIFMDLGMDRSPRARVPRCVVQAPGTEEHIGSSQASAHQEATSDGQRASEAGPTG